jgi:hypothetical protein
MQRDRRRALVAAIVLLAAVASTAGYAATAEAAAGSGTTTGTNTTADATEERSDIGEGEYDSHDSIVLTQEFRLTPDRPGRIDVQWHFRIPDRVSDVRTRLPPDATNVRTTRFSRDGDLYVWSGDTTTASITFTLPANETTDRTGPEAPEGRLKFVDAGDWALTRRPPVTRPGYSYPRGQDPGVAVRNTTAGEGVVGEALLYLGPHETVERTAHGQRFRLVVPERATVAADRGEVLDSVTDASDRLRVGDRDEQVLMIAAPTAAPWGVLGLQTGQRDFYVLADEPVDAPDNTWLHEYVHTRQDIDSAESTRWFYEASAEYYAAQLTLEQDRIEYEAFREYLDRGTRQRFAPVRLVDPATWRSDGGDYTKGALVAGELDRRVRVATDGGATFQGVFRRMNRGGSVTHSDFVGYVRATGGDGVVDPARRYTETTDRPQPWSRERHQEAFGGLPPRFRYDLPDRGSDGLRVRSQYREGALGTTDLVAGESLVLDVTVENVGGAAGEYDLAVTVDGSPVATRTGRLETGASATTTVEYTFSEPGSRRISTGEDSLTLEVREPAPLEVTSLSADRTEVRPGEQVTLAATVENPAARPGQREVSIRRDGTEVASRQVRLGPGGSAEVAASVSLAEAGSYRFESGDRTVTVTVAAPDTATPTPTDASGGTGDGTGVSGPGFGPLAALAGLAALAASLLVCQRVQ